MDDLSQNVVDLSEQQLIYRAKELARDNLKILYSIIKAIGLTTATIVLLNIFRDFNEWPFSFHGIGNILSWHWDYAKHLRFDIRLFLWLTSCITIILTHDAAMFATIFLHRKVGYIESLLIFSFVGFEFFLFAVLFPNYFLGDHITGAVPQMLFFWFFINGTYTLAVCLLSWRTIRCIGDTKFYDSSLIIKIERHYCQDFLETLFFGLLNIFGAVHFLNVKFDNSMLLPAQAQLQDANPAYLRQLHLIVLNSCSILFLTWLSYVRQYKRRRIIAPFLQEVKKKSLGETLCLILGSVKNLYGFYFINFMTLIITNIKKSPSLIKKISQFFKKLIKN